MDLTDNSIHVDYSTVEELFASKTILPKETEKIKKPTEINLLDMKRSMNVNIFLKQFKMTNDAVVELIRHGDDAKIGVEKLKGLLKILPEKDEIAAVRSYDGEREKLGNAEQFYAHLLELPSYRLRVELMLFRSELGDNVEELTPKLGAVIAACEEIINSHSLTEFLGFTLQTGNFINTGCYAGNAVGFRVTSLTKLVDTRSNKPRLTLLHFLVDEVCRQNDDAIKFVDALSQSLAVAARQSIEALTCEVNQLASSVKTLTSQLTNANDVSLNEQFSSFLQNAADEVGKLKEQLGRINELTGKLAVRYCEDEKTFRLDDLLATFHSFCQLVQQCRKDNEQRKIQEEKAAARRKLQEMKSEKKDEAGKQTGPVKEEGCIVDRLLADIRQGTTLRRSGSTRRSKRSSATSPPKELPEMYSQDQDSRINTINA